MALLIESVTPANSKGVAIGSAVTDIPDPTTYQWGKQDISASDAGRTADMRMVKMLQGKTRTLKLQWNYPDFADAASILQTFDYEYLIIKYKDALTNTFKTSHMYCGDMDATCYTATGDGLWENISFTCIQATPDSV
jgi:hypothetical protein